MSERFGVCRNQDYCALALQRTVLRLGPDELFVCPECARPLSAASAWKTGGAGYRALLRLAPPLGIVGIGLAAIWLGLQHSDGPPAPFHAGVRPGAPHLAGSQAPHLAGSLAPHLAGRVAASRTGAPRLASGAPADGQGAVRPPPAERSVARPGPVHTVVVLRVSAAPPLNDSVLPQLAAGYLAAAYHGLAVMGTVDDVGHVVLTVGGRILDILVTSAAFDAAAFASGQTDVVCAADEPIAGQLQAAGALTQVPLGDMPGPAADRILCYGRPEGEAAAFLAYLGTPAARQIVASAGYDFQPVAQPPPVAAPILAAVAAPVVAAKAVSKVAAKPGAKTVAKPVGKPVAKPVAKTPAKTPPKTAVKTVATAGAKIGAKMAPKVGVKVVAKPAGPQLGVAAMTDAVAPHGNPAATAAGPANNPAPEAAPEAAPDAALDAAPPPEADAAPGPRRIIVPPGSPLTMAALKAMIASGVPAPDQAANAAAPHPRTVYLPASARLAFGTYQPVKMPEAPPRLVFVRPDAAIRPGSLKADCNIGVDGVPSDCREMSHDGTAEAAAAIMAWLPSGGIRYMPVVKDGHSVQERRVITVTFGGKGGH